MWRILIGLGCVPGTIALFFRLTIPETPRFTMDIERNIDQAIQDIDKFLKTGTFKIDPDARIERVNAPRASFRDFKAYFSDRENFRVLFGCSYCWFVLDVSQNNLLVNHAALICLKGCVLRTWTQLAGFARRLILRGGQTRLRPTHQYCQREYHPRLCRIVAWICALLSLHRSMGSKATTVYWVCRIHGTVYHNGQAIFPFSKAIQL